MRGQVIELYAAWCRLGRRTAANAALSAAQPAGHGPQADVLGFPDLDAHARGGLKLSVCRSCHLPHLTGWQGVALQI
jgi:hypothetical protein